MNLEIINPEINQQSNFKRKSDLLDSALARSNKNELCDTCSTARHPIFHLLETQRSTIFSY